MFKAAFLLIVGVAVLAAIAAVLMTARAYRRLQRMRSSAAERVAADVAKVASAPPTGDVTVEDVASRSTLLLRDYEMLYIIRPELDDQQLAETVRSVERLIASLGGSPVKSDVWGRRRLVGELRHHREGVYVLTEFRIEPFRVLDMETPLKSSDTIVRHLIVRKPERMGTSMPNVQSPRQKLAERSQELTDSKEWEAQGFSGQEATRWIGAGITVDDATLYRSMSIAPDEVRPVLPLDQLARYVKAGWALEDAHTLASAQVPIEKAQAWRAHGLPAWLIAYLHPEIDDPVVATQRALSAISRERMDFDNELTTRGKGLPAY